ncbi:MAG: hypothetical protein JXA57_03865 [Armatimonadetes bacterium]|nr:hypothetical protein [Armatimonadota bacterium]
MREAGAQCIVYQCVREAGISGCHECTQEVCVLGKWSPAQCPLRMRFGGADTGSEFEEKLDVTRGKATVGEDGSQLPVQKMRRVHGYLVTLNSYAGMNVATVSSHQLARGVGVRASLVRRDLSELGSFGTPGRGYDVGRLTSEIRGVLHLQRTRRAVWLGDASALSARATLSAAEMANCGLIGVFDDARAGRSADGYVVQPLSKAATEVKKRSATVAVVAGEDAADPKLLSRLVAAGIQAVLNLTSVRLELPAAIIVEQCDLGSQLLRLVSRMGDESED